ncbi:Concanavalin A-like lectin/glucanases domain-containing protein [Desulfonema magnum]|uniref:Concanavalin A-like lectin/glucanases domain-containing protein n=2 Tax=Desulfonema magnum TaxID=45655 RepID=A0A975BUJ0_9BACT|nr:Concanavalin A-like lectin/glucanases domain-containing protein [Desulfonema magnum]
MLLVTAAGAAILSMNKTSSYNELNFNNSQKALYLAESGIRYAKLRGMEDGDKKTYTLSDNGGTFHITRTGNTIESVGIVNEGSSFEARRRIFDNSYLSDLIKNGLIGHWKLDETSGTTAADSSPYGNDGTLQNEFSFDGDSLPGKLDRCLDFDGTDDLIQTPDNDDKLQLSGDYTSSVWIRAHPSQNNWAGIYTKVSPDGKENHWNLQFNDDAPKKLIVMHSGDNEWDTGITLDHVKGDWHHVAIVRSGTTQTSYIDGIREKSDTWSVNPKSGNGHLNIGGDRTASDTYIFQGRIDDLRIYNRALSPEEIEFLYNLGG